MRIKWSYYYFKDVCSIFPDGQAFLSSSPWILSDGNEAVLNLLINSDGRANITDVAFKTQLMLFFMELGYLLNNWHHFLIHKFSPYN